jgi:hypothetical protein
VKSLKLHCIMQPVQCFSTSCQRFRHFYLYAGTVWQQFAAQHRLAIVPHTGATVIRSNGKAPGARGGPQYTTQYAHTCTQPLPCQCLCSTCMTLTAHWHQNGLTHKLAPGNAASCMKTASCRCTVSVLD